MPSSATPTYKYSTLITHSLEYITSLVKVNIGKTGSETETDSSSTLENNNWTNKVFKMHDSVYSLLEWNWMNDTCDVTTPDLKSMVIVISSSSFILLQ